MRNMGNINPKLTSFMELQKTKNNNKVLLGLKEENVDEIQTLYTYRKFIWVFIIGSNYIILSYLINPTWPPILSKLNGLFNNINPVQLCRNVLFYQSRYVILIFIMIL